MHGKALRRRWEFFLGGNTGTAMWAALARVELGRRNLTYEAEHVRCALRHLLRPSAAVLAAMARLRPGVSTTPPPPSASSSSLTAELTVGIHVRIPPAGRPRPPQQLQILLLESQPSSHREVSRQGTI